MADSNVGSSNRQGNWTSIINAVQTPLGFFTLFALILDGILIAVAATTDKISLWVPLIILALLLLCVTAIAMIKPKVFYHPRDWPADRVVVVKVVFPEIQPIDVDIDENNCYLVVRNRRGKFRRALNLVLGQGGWQCELPDINPSDAVRLEIAEASGRRWQVRPFDPYETVVTASRWREQV